MALRLLASVLVLAGADSAVQLTPTAVDGAVCINGAPAYVHTNVQAGVKDWIVQLGGDSVGLTWCISPEACAMFATPPSAPAPAPAPTGLPGSGPMSDNCTVNPTFCHFNRAEIDMCDFSLYLGDAEVPQNGTVPAMHFQGKKLLQASLQKLASLGLSSAERVLLTGVGFGGTAAILNADTVAAQLKALVPSLKDFRVLPADGVHPKHGNVLFSDVGGVDAFSGYLEGNFKISNAGPALAPGCLAKHPADPWMCMYVNETLPFMKTPVYLVNQLASLWDTQCDLAGMGSGNILQIQCIPKNRIKQMFQWHICFQYTERCTGTQITDVVAPFQQQYIDDTMNSGVMGRPGNGGFMHSCHLGAYWNSVDPSKGPVWQAITIGGVSMQQAITTWWNSATTAPSVFTKDCIWSPTAAGHMCNPVCNGFPPYFGDASESDKTMIV